MGKDQGSLGVLCGGVVVRSERGKREKAEHVHARRQFILENNTLAGAEETRGRKTLGFLLLGLRFYGTRARVRIAMWCAACAS
jgi:hypothetical protein